jgi:hypothetical protein
MGTRALVHFYEGDTEICCLYRQFDGYPEGLGKELEDFCATRPLVNGYTHRECANGMGDLAAQLVCLLKGKPLAGNVYLYPLGSRDVGEEYTYDVRGPADLPHRGHGTITVYAVVTVRGRS